MYYLKESLFIFFYELIMSTIALAVLAIEATWLKITLSIVCIAFFLFIVVSYFMQEGQRALKKRHQNDIQRKRMIDLGEIIEIDSKTEYQVWKGFVVGTFTFIPMFILLFVYAIILICGGTSTVFNGINSFVYLLFSAPLITIFTSFQGAICFSVLYGAVLTSIASGIGYILGARKIQRQYDAIEIKQKFLHGEE